MSPTEGTLFLSLLFFFSSLQSNVWFCFSPPHNEIKTISNRRTCRKERFFSICYFMLGCERSQDHVSPGRRLTGILHVGRLGKVHEGERGHPGCVLVTLVKPMVTSIVFLGREVCLCHKLHPGPGSQAIHVCPKQVFSCETGKETAGKTSWWIIFNPVCQECVCPNVSLVPCSRGTR